jgi:hypothetical protein
MKKSLLIPAALLITISGISQQSRPKFTAPAVDMAAEWSAKLERMNRAEERTTIQSNVKPADMQAPALQRGSSMAPIVWNPISGSMNVYGVLVSSSKPLQYNNELGAVSFIHRKSPTYQPNPYPTPLGAETGAIVGMVTTNWGASWDSTCIWNDNNNWARYPQGGISNPVMTNTALSNAYIVATGPITQANTSLGWTGNYFASKSLSTFDNVASTTPNAQQFIPNQAPYGPVGRVDFARINFSATDDGKVRTLGAIYNTNGATATGFRGVRIVTGSFNSGVYTWTGDSLPVIVTTDSNDGTLNWIGGLYNQAWSEDGSIGYAWYYGCRTGATGNNIGYQPIVFKSTNGGAWTAINSIDFNDKAKFKKPVLDHLFPAFLDTASIIPFVDWREGVDGTVDANGQLHIMMTLWSASRSHPDSTGYAYTSFTNWDGETYSFIHGMTSLDDLFQTTGMDATQRMNRPYIYDFYTLSNGTWSVAVVDSMSSEAPGETSAADGFSDNPWNLVDGSKAGSDARFQMSRTPGGSKIIYTWAESDTNYTTQGRKWNHVNNVKARLLDVNPSFGVPAYSVHKAEYNLSNPLTGGVNPYVKDRAQMHNTSPVCAVTATAVGGYTVTLPIKVTNNQNTPMQQETPTVHWYTSAALEFTVATDDTKLDENTANGLTTILYPNPSAGNTHVQIDLAGGSKVSVTVLNSIGQVVSTTSADGQPGRNDISINTTGLANGIYIVQVRAGDSTASRKLIIE